MMKLVGKAIEVRIYPRRVDKNDNGEKTVSINKIESNIGDVLIKLFCDNKKI